MKNILRLILFCSFLYLPLISKGQEEKRSFEKREPQRFESTHSGTFGGQKMDYTAIVSETFLKNAEGEVTAALWSTAYLKKGGNSSTRPVMFIFNGGPGSASIWRFFRS